MERVNTTDFKAQSAKYGLTYKSLGGLACAGILTCLGSWFFQNRWSTSLSFKATLLTASTASLAGAYVFKQHYDHTALMSSLQTSCARMQASVLEKANSVPEHDKKSSLHFLVETMQGCETKWRFCEDTSQQDIATFVQQFDRLSNLVVCAKSWKSSIDQFDPQMANVTQRGFLSFCDAMALWSRAWLDLFDKTQNVPTEGNDRFKEAECAFFSTLCLDERPEDSLGIPPSKLNELVKQLQTTLKDPKNTALLSQSIRNALLSQVDHIVNTVSNLEAELAACNTHPQKELLTRVLNARLVTLRDWQVTIHDTDKNEKTFNEKILSLRFYILRDKHFQQLVNQLMNFPHAPQKYFIPMPALKPAILIDATQPRAEQREKQWSSIHGQALVFSASNNAQLDSWSYDSKIEDAKVIP